MSRTESGGDQFISFRGNTLQEVDSQVANFYTVLPRNTKMFRRSYMPSSSMKLPSDYPQPTMPPGVDSPFGNANSVFVVDIIYRDITITDLDTTLIEDKKGG